jgi:twitching motility protein PilJ
MKESTKALGIVLAVLMGLAALSLAIWNFKTVTTNAKHDKEYLGLVGELRVLSQGVSKNASEAASGVAEGFRLLKESRDRFQSNLTVLKEGNAVTGLPASPEQVAVPLSELDTAWSKVDKNVDQILSGEQGILSSQDIVESFNTLISKQRAFSGEVIRLLIDKKAAQSQIYNASRQLLLTERIASDVIRALQGGQGTTIEDLKKDFEKYADSFGQLSKAMLEGDKRMNLPRMEDQDVRVRLQESQRIYPSIKSLGTHILKASPKIFQAHEAADSISASSNELLNLSTELESAYVALEQQRSFLQRPAVGYAAGLFTLLFLGVLGVLLLGTGRKRTQETTEENRRNQEAILRLLDEMGDLADGDLTVHATVTEDFTGAIADSINYAIDALRKLVFTNNETAVRVSSAAQETQATAMHLAEASDHQAHEIAGAGAAVNEMTVSIEQVSEHAGESAEVARRSVEYAHRGTEAVQNTMQGMDTIREQIQETSKRIKRLGESSQEIGDIIGLINDIADQTNILALNAAIQAAMAGEAGRGFAVVADEVQRLAERSGNATKQIEALVKTIQTDTNEAVISMEHTTTQVVEGAKLAQRAGETLEQIEVVSKDLADLILGISETARQQASAASNISNTMSVVQEITAQTSSGTNATAVSIGNLADLASELRKSVAGFKLPK